VFFSELPIFTTKAHVFHIDPDTKKKWLPLSTEAVSVSYYHDSARHLYRIISVDGTKVTLLNMLCTSDVKSNFSINDNSSLRIG